MSEKGSKVREKTKPGFLEALSMIIVLLALVVYSVKQDISIIPAMFLAIVWAMLVALRHGYTWEDLMPAVYEREKGVMGVFFIILLIGSFIGMMIYSGTIPTIIYYLIKIINPSWMVLLTFLVCTIVSVIIGTSWGTAGTVGVIMIAIAQSMGVPIPLVAGAVASGSHVGQLLTPMADTTNVAASFANTDTMNMIKRCAYYTIPVIILSIVGYFILGLTTGSGSGSLETAEVISREIAGTFNVNPLVIIPMAVVFVMTFKKKPIAQTLGTTCVIGLFFGMVFNKFSFAAGLNTLFNGFTLSGTAGLDEAGFSSIFVNLCNRGGAMSMISPALIVIVAAMYGTILLEVKALDVIADTLFAKIHSRVLLTISAEFLAALIVGLTSSSFLAGMMPRDLFKKKFEDEGMDATDLVSSAVSVSTQYLTCIPWCDTAVFIAGIAGVSTLSYLPYNFFGWGCSVMAIILSIFGIGFKNGKRMWAIKEPGDENTTSAVV